MIHFLRLTAFALISLAVNITCVTQVHAEQEVACAKCQMDAYFGYLGKNCSQCSDVQANGDAACAQDTPNLAPLTNFISYSTATGNQDHCQMVGTYKAVDGEIQTATVTLGYVLGCADGWEISDIPTNRCLMTQDVYVNPPSTCSVNPAYDDPVYPLTGTERHTEPSSISLSGRQLDFTYDTIRAPWMNHGSYVSQPGEKPIFGQLGKLWWSSLHRQLFIQPGQQNAFAMRGDGRVVSFSLSASGELMPPADEQDRLTKINKDGVTNYLYRSQADSFLEVYDANGVFQRGVSKDDARWTPTFSTTSTLPSLAPGAGYLLSLVDAFNRSVQFTYRTLSTGDVVVNTLTGPDGRPINFNYDTNGNLASIQWQDGTTRTFVYDSPNVGQSWALTGVIDENGKRTASVSYDPAGWVNGAQMAGGVDAHVFAYATPPTPTVTEVPDPDNLAIWRYHEWLLPTALTVTNPNGGTFDLQTQAVLVRSGAPSSLGSPRVSGFSQPAGAGCGASSSNIAFDANGNVARADDFNQHRMCSAFDLMRNLETARVEGLSATAACSSVIGTGAVLSAGARKTSTTWHPDWRVPVLVAEPGRITTYTYNGQSGASCAPSSALLPDGKPIAVLCKKSEQATTDADGHLGFSAASQAGVAPAVSSFTYNANGQVLTAKDSLGNVTTSTYYTDTAFTGTDPNAVGHTMGDLQTVKDSSGNVTQYTQYDKSGRLLTSIDPNGVTSKFSYAPRGWLKSSTVGGSLTTFAYWPTGLLQQATLPNGSFVSYRYDDAHRLTDVADNTGNAIHYALDNAGNSTEDDLKDPSGVLQAELGRVMDALNRTQQTTGRE